MTLKQILLNQGAKKAKSLGYNNTQITKCYESIRKDKEITRTHTILSKIILDSPIKDFLLEKYYLTIKKSKL